MKKSPDAEAPGLATMQTRGLSILRGQAGQPDPLANRMEDRLKENRGFLFAKLACDTRQGNDFEEENADDADPTNVLKRLHVDQDDAGDDPVGLFFTSPVNIAL